MNLLECCNALKIDFTNTIIETCGGIEVSNQFDYLPKDFLRFAKKDFKDTIDKDRGLINALTNSKRAIDCQIDNSFSIYGINYSKISKKSGSIISVCDLDSKNLPHKLKLVQALSLAPSGLVSKTRTLRNKLEHYYKKPLEKDVIEALELAELFILSIESHFKVIEHKFKIYDKNIKEDIMRTPILVNIEFNFESKHFEVFIVNQNKVGNGKSIFSEVNEEYYGLLKLMNNLDDELDCQEALRCLLNLIGHPIPTEKIRLHELIKVE